MELGYHGKEIGKFLEDAYSICLGSPEQNDHEKLINTAKKKKKIIQKKIGREDNALDAAIADAKEKARQLRLQRSEHGGYKEINRIKE